MSETVLVNKTRSHYKETPFDFGSKIREQIFKQGLTYKALTARDWTNKQIVEVGCSISFVGRWLKENFPKYNYLGVDLNPKAVELALRQGIKAVEGNNLNLHLKDNFSDFTLSEGVIHHTPNPIKAFKELVRITKKGGLISLYVYNKNHYYYYVYKLGWFIRKLYGNELTKPLVKHIIFPLFDVFYVQLGNRLYFGNKETIPKKLSWNVFSDQVLTPVAHFFTSKQVKKLAKKHGLRILRESRSINGQGLQFLIQK